MDPIAQKRILVAEDGEYNRDLLVQILGDDYRLVMALDGKEAVIKAAEEKPDLILMDLGLPVMDGWEATKKIKANSALTQIPIIAVTSHAMRSEERKAREAGCDDYLPKPIDEDILMEKIKKYI